MRHRSYGDALCVPVCGEERLRRAFLRIAGLLFQLVLGRLRCLNASCAEDALRCLSGGDTLPRSITCVEVFLLHAYGIERPAETLRELSRTGEISRIVPFACCLYEAARWRELARVRDQKSALPPLATTSRGCRPLAVVLSQDNVEYGLRPVEQCEPFQLSENQH